MTPFTENVISIIQAIPEGKVMCYGQIAALAGSPRGARQVVRILHSGSRKHLLPWHRVISSSGEISMPSSESRDMQLFLLRTEGIEITHNRFVDLNRYQYRPLEDPFTPE